MTNNPTKNTMIKNKIISDAWREINDGDDDDGSATVGTDVGFSVDSVTVINWCIFKKYTIKLKYQLVLTMSLWVGLSDSSSGQ